MKKFVRSMFSVFLLFLLVFNLNGEVAYASSTVGQDINSRDIELIKDEEGNFLGRSTITKPGTKKVDVAVVDISLRADTTIRNLYTVVYKITSTDLVSGIAASEITIKNSNVLDNQTYYSQPLSHTFVSSLLTFGSNGGVIIPPDVSKVKIKTKDLKVYWDSGGWLSASNVNKTEKVN